jgi:transposase
VLPKRNTIYALIETAKVNDIDPQAWLADVLARTPDHPAKRISDLLHWNWRPQKPPKQPKILPILTPCGP